MTRFPTKILSANKGKWRQWGDPLKENLSTAEPYSTAFPGKVLKTKAKGRIGACVGGP